MQVSNCRFAMATVLLLLLSHGTGCLAVTLQEANLDKTRYIHFDQAPFLVWMHALVALAILYGILLFIWGFVTAFMKITGRQRQRRSYEDSNSKPS